MGLVLAVVGMGWLAAGHGASYVAGVELPMALIGAGQGLAFIGTFLLVGALIAAVVLILPGARTVSTPGR